MWISKPCGPSKPPCSPIASLAGGKISPSGSVGRLPSVAGGSAAGLITAGFSTLVSGLALSVFGFPAEPASLRLTSRAMERNKAVTGLPLPPRKASRPLAGVAVSAVGLASGFASAPSAGFASGLASGFVSVLASVGTSVLGSGFASAGLSAAAAFPLALDFFFGLAGLLPPVGPLSSGLSGVPSLPFAASFALPNFGSLGRLGILPVTLATPSNRRSARVTPGTSKGNSFISAS